MLLIVIMIIYWDIVNIQQNHKYDDNYHHQHQYTEILVLVLKLDLMRIRNTSLLFYSNYHS